MKHKYLIQEGGLYFLIEATKRLQSNEELLSLLLHGWRLVFVVVLDLVSATVNRERSSKKELLCQFLISIFFH